MEQIPDVTPDDYLSDKPPARIMGEEIEVTVQNGSNHGVVRARDFIQAEALEDLGLTSFRAPSDNKVWLGNGAKIYPDSVEILEYCVPESRGSRELTAAHFAATAVLHDLVGQVAPNGRLYMHTGSAVNDSYSSRGFHENHLVPAEVMHDSENRKLLHGITTTYLASRVWAGAGLVGPDGYELSQKAPSIGVAMTREAYGMTLHGRKPLIRLRLGNDNYDVAHPEEGFIRCEYRLAESGASEYGRFMSLATGSLALRLVEHADRLPANFDARTLALNHPEQAVHRFSTDISFTATSETIAGTQVSAIDIQEGLAIAVLELGDCIELPGDELWAAHSWVDLCDRVRRSDLRTDTFDPIVRQLDFAAKFAYLRHKLPHVAPLNLTSHNIEAVKASFTWDRLYPEGPGERFADRAMVQTISAADRSYYYDQPPQQTRAAQRAAAISDPNVELRYMEWGSYTYRSEGGIDYKVRLPAG